jgi:hypothetical protein
MSEVTEEQWHVQVEAGDVRLWTLDQLDAAFKAELVDESTFVLEVGKTEWMQLGTLLGGGDEDEESAPEAEAAPAYVRAAPLAPVMLSESPASMGPYSTAPMASDIGDDLDSPASFRASRKRPVAIGIGVVLLAAGVAVFASSRGAFSAELPSPQVAAAAIAAPAPPPPAPAPPAADPPSQNAPANLAARLTQDQLQKLADADKVHEAKLSAQQKARAAAAPHASHGGHKMKEKGPFHSGGDKYDPLNAKL